MILILKPFYTNIPSKFPFGHIDLKMIGLYLNVLRIFNELRLQTELNNCVTKMCFGQHGKTKQHQQRKLPKQSSPEPGIEPLTVLTSVKCVTSGSPSHLHLPIVIKLYNCFNCFIASKRK